MDRAHRNGRTYTDCHQRLEVRLCEAVSGSPSYKSFQYQIDKDGNVDSPSLLNNLVDSEVAPRPLS